MKNDDFSPMSPPPQIRFAYPTGILHVHKQQVIGLAIAYFILFIIT